jgi:SAM-dependent methyltransferase
LRFASPQPADDPSGRWEAFARQDPQFYIDPTVGRDVDAEHFIEGGRGVVEQVLEWTGEVGTPDRALEIGCGIGRDTVHLARHFRHVDGVDISATMVRSARNRGLPKNVRLHVLSGRDLDAFESESVSFVFSHLVFQHVTDDAIVGSYLREVARVLKPDGVAALQFDTRRTQLLAGLVQRLPDPLLPAIRRRGIRRHRRPASQIRALGRAAGLTLDAEQNPDTAEHWFRWRRDTSGSIRGSPRRDEPATS